MSDIMAIVETSIASSLDRLSVISHNLANSTNTGYKRDIYIDRGFQKIFTSAVNNRSHNNLAVESRKTITDMQPGVLKFTGNSLDLAIEGDAYFQVKTKNGIGYTRNGAFGVDSSGRLITKHGHIIQGVDGDIRVNTTTPRIDDSGNIWDRDKYEGQLALIRFENSESLVKSTDGIFFSSNSGRQIDLKQSNQIRQGYLEASNVNAMKEMVDLMMVVRQVEASQKAILGYDQMLETAIRDIAEF
ncbi:MAG: flagellar hook-basal body protein [Candidatus Thiodiazotropha sp. (ex Dulcina madagascariensis)]|nr:flagellar hook-basal body protein [Candidatus Thiodiazotropha sp. (ex Dulcina madagascariensis)]MCU7925830.1 flagellar hook-basal body protein [Candidatus Thiodiazotropha sp. (ex Dulcina madagascariensis)]